MRLIGDPIKSEKDAIAAPFAQCPREDLNLHAQKGTGPQPAAYAYSATGAPRNPL